MGDIGRDGTIPVDQASKVTVPVFVLTGGADYPWMTDVGRRLADAMPNGRHRVLEGQERVVPPRCSCRCWPNSSPTKAAS
jgi:pimeloyl-ACP methyl ester carboxylesterase